MLMLIFIICAYVIGFLAAIPVGATQLEIARRSLHGYRISALVLITGSMLSDFMYGTLSLFGLADFLRIPMVSGIFWICNAILLIGLGVWSLGDSNISFQDDSSENIKLKSKNIAFITGFSLAVTNPLMVIWWLIGIHFLGRISPIDTHSASNKIIFLIAGTIGLGSYSTVLMIGIYKTKKFLPKQVIRRITVYFSVALFLLGGYSIVKAVLELVR
jgi:threonine/homoserine/homoserine lactone efflux protein